MEVILTSFTAGTREKEAIVWKAKYTALKTKNKGLTVKEMYI